jgi:hypothetical protein
MISDNRLLPLRIIHTAKMKRVCVCSQLASLLRWSTNLLTVRARNDLKVVGCIYFIYFSFSLCSLLFLLPHISHLSNLIPALFGMI